jgi:hypothetical protein
MSIVPANGHVLGKIIHDGRSSDGAVTFRIESLGDGAFEKTFLKPTIGDLVILDPLFNSSMAYFVTVNGVPHIICEDSRVIGIIEPE